MSNEFASSKLTAGQLNAIVKKLGGLNGALRFLRGELVVSEPTPLWREKDDIIYFSVTSNGTTGKAWIARLKKKGFRVGDYGKQMLRSSCFQPTSGVTTEVAVLKGTFFEEDDRTARKIRVEAGNRKLEEPNAEVACLIREKFTDEELEAMGLWYIVVMHEPISVLGSYRSLLSADRRDGGKWLYAHYVHPDDGWQFGGGFAFALSQ